jgi:hypothetical protein
MNKQWILVWILVFAVLWELPAQSTDTLTMRQRQEYYRQEAEASLKAEKTTGTIGAIFVGTGLLAVMSGWGMIIDDPYDDSMVEGGLWVGGVGLGLVAIGSSFMLFSHLHSKRADKMQQKSHVTLAPVYYPGPVPVAGVGVRVPLGR